MFKGGRLLRLFIHYFKFNLSAGMEYRAAFLVQIFGMILNNSAFIVFWIFLFNKIGGSIKGYEFSDVMFLWSLTATGYGIGVVFFGNAGAISRIIYNGELDVYLLQPKPVIPNLVCSRMIISGWGDIFYGIILFFITQPLGLQKILFFLIFALLMAFVLTALKVLYHSLTFFFGNSEAFARTASELSIAFMIYPSSIFKGPTVWLLHSIIPAALLAYIPIKIFKSFDLTLMLGLLAGDLLIVLLAFAIFHMGLRKYESGNKMGTRI